MWRLIFALALICAILFALFKTITAASQDSTRPKIDPALRSAVKDWEERMQREGLAYSNRFNGLEVIARVGRETAWVGRTSRATRSIEINDRQVASGQLRLLCTVYHELGHWTFGLGHSSGIMAEECPSEEYLAANWEKLVEEYVNQCRNNQFIVNTIIP